MISLLPLASTLLVLPVVLCNPRAQPWQQWLEFFLHFFLILFFHFPLQGDTLIVDKLVFSSTAKETFVVPFVSDERPDPACWFTAFLSVNSLDVKQDCIKNLNNDKDLTFTPPGRLFFHTAPSSQVSNPDFVLQSFECAEQNCNPGVAGGDDCRFDQSCTAFGFSTGDMVRQMTSDVRLQFQKNKWTVAIAALPDYKISFNLTWIVDAVGVVPTAGTPSPGGVTTKPGGVTPGPGGVTTRPGGVTTSPGDVTPSPGGAPQLDGTTMGEDTGPATVAAAPDNTVTIVIASVVGLVVCLIIVLVIVYVVMRAKTQQAQLNAGYPSSQYSNGNVASPDAQYATTSAATSRSFTESSQFGRSSPSYTSAGYTGGAGNSTGYGNGSTGEAYGMMQLGQPMEAYGSMPDPSQPPFGGFRSAAGSFVSNVTPIDNAQPGGYTDIAFQNSGSATELPDLPTKPW
jgi:hypothetical protein